MDNLVIPFTIIEYFMSIFIFGVVLLILGSRMSVIIRCLYQSFGPDSDWILERWLRIGCSTGSCTGQDGLYSFDDWKWSPGPSVSTFQRFSSGLEVIQVLMEWIDFLFCKGRSILVQIVPTITPKVLPRKVLVYKTVKK